MIQRGLLNVILKSSTIIKNLGGWALLAQLVRSLHAFRPQGPQFDPRLWQNLNICVTFFPT